MRRPLPWRLPLAGVFVGALSWSTLAAAQTASPEDMAAARALGTEGFRLADAGDCAGAIAKLSASEKIFHAPTTMERLGECEIKVGKIVAGTEHLQHVIREPLAPNAPPAFTIAKQKAQDALGPALPRIAQLKVHVDGATPDKVAVTVDGTPMSSALLDAPRPTDPGPHEIKASASGFKTATTMVTLGDGGQSAVNLKLEPDPTAVAAPAPPPPATTAPGAPPDTTAATATPPPPAPAVPGQPAPAAEPPIAAISLLVVGGVGVGVGTIFGVLAMGAKSTLDGECGPSKKACNKQSDIDALNTDALVSDIGFGVGVVGLAVGAVLLVSHHSEAAASNKPHVTPWIGFGSAGVGGTFE